MIINTEVLKSGELFGKLRKCQLLVDTFYFRVIYKRIPIPMGQAPI